MASGDSFTPAETGWLGLTLNEAAGAVDTFDFIEQLSTATFLTTKQFGLHLSYESGGTSYVDFGVVKSASIQPSATKVALKVQ